MKRINNVKSILALVLCTVLLLTAMLTLSSCKKDKFTYELSEDKTYYTVTGYTGKDAKIEIPTEYNELPVKAIGREAFKAKTGIESVVIPDGIVTIEFKAFEGCTKLSSITIADSVETIDKGAFLDCTALTTVTLPAGITTIDDAVFQNCTALKSVSIPKSVISVSSYAFINCPELNYFNVDVSNHHYAFKNNSLIDLENNILVVGMSDATIPANLGIEAIAPNAFHSRAIVNIVIPDTVKSIGNLAFYNCQNLESVEILGAETIGEYAFANCALLRKIVISSSVTEIAENAFASLPKLTNVFYGGYAFEFIEIDIANGNEDFTKANIYYYTDEEPDGEGKYWHYVNGTVTIWL